MWGWITRVCLVLSGLAAIVILAQRVGLSDVDFKYWKILGVSSVAIIQLLIEWRHQRAKAHSQQILVLDRLADFQAVLPKFLRVTLKLADSVNKFITKRTASGLGPPVMNSQLRAALDTVNGERIEILTMFEEGVSLVIKYGVHTNEIPRNLGHQILLAFVNNDLMRGDLSTMKVSGLDFDLLSKTIGHFRDLIDSVKNHEDLEQYVLITKELERKNGST